MRSHPRHGRRRSWLAAGAAALLLAVASTTGGPAAGAATRANDPPSLVPKDDPARGLVYGTLRAARTGPCAGGFEVVGVTGLSRAMCTHGPDPAPSGLSVARSVRPVPAAATPQALAVCDGDGVSGRRVEVLYVHGSTDRYNQFLETFRALAEGVDTIFNESARETGGERHVRYVTETVGGACRPVVRNVTIPDSALNANDWAPLLNAVRAAGYTRTDRKYLQFVDARVFCGIGGFAGDTAKSDSNRSNFGPEYARVDSGCWNAGVAAHELGHTLGAVNNNAPNGSGLAHCVDEWDVMCYKDAPATVIQIRCPDRAHDQRLDCNHDDYYHTSPPAGSYLATFYNVADNLFLLRGGATPPPTTFQLVNAASGRCLDDPAGNTANGTQLIIWTCNGGTNQAVTQSGGTLRILGKCLDTRGGTGNGTPVVLWDCNQAASQQWTARADGSVAGTPSGRCLNPNGGATVNNTPIVLSDCNGAASQRWTRA